MLGLGFSYIQTTSSSWVYEGMGFTDARRVTLAEDFVANGDSDLVPADSADTEEHGMRWYRRIGLAMERVVWQYYETMTSE